jgi:hypothetical protein
LTASAVVGETCPNRFALGAATPFPPTFSNSFSRNLSFNKRRRQLMAGNAQELKEITTQMFYKLFLLPILIML